ncbi:hypothetical protein OIO90_003076 [Microbotryomycetes sp. JL221]|nr:hypothetical protein OIO90_003076 [Microbotryomycetes sp. JL221]
MQAVKDAAAAVQRALGSSSSESHSSSVAQQSSTTTTKADSSLPSASELATQVKDKLNLTDHSSKDADVIEGKHALEKMNELADAGGQGSTKVDDEVKEVTKEADSKAVSQHDKLVSEIERKVPELKPTAEGGVGDPSAAKETNVPRVQDEIRDAAPDADVSAVQAHTLLVSEIENVVDKDASKPVHETVNKVSVDEPAELKNQN